MTLCGRRNVVKNMSKYGPAFGAVANSPESPAALGTSALHSVGSCGANHRGAPHSKRTHQ